MGDGPEKPIQDQKENQKKETACKLRGGRMGGGVNGNRTEKEGEKEKERKKKTPERNG